MDGGRDPARGGRERRETRTNSNRDAMTCARESPLNLDDVEVDELLEGLQTDEASHRSRDRDDAFARTPNDALHLQPSPPHYDPSAAPSLRPPSPLPDALPSAQPGLLLREHSLQSLHCGQSSLDASHRNSIPRLSSLNLSSAHPDHPGGNPPSGNPPAANVRPLSSSHSGVVPIRGGGVGGSQSTTGQVPSSGHGSQLLQPGSCLSAPGPSLDPSPDSSHASQNPSHASLPLPGPSGPFDEVVGETAVINNVAGLNERIAGLFNQPDLSDVTLVVTATRFDAHRLVLATGSDVFKVMLLSASWQDSKQEEILLEERPECLHVFSEFLKYFYTGTITMTTDKAIPILVLADKYAVEDLRDSVIKFMIANIAQQSDTNRTISWYQYAKSCGHTELKNRCCEFIVWNMRVVIKSPDWISLDLENLIEFLDYSDMVITDEYTLLKALEIWVRTNSVENFCDDAMELGAATKTDDDDDLQPVRHPLDRKTSDNLLHARHLLDSIDVNAASKTEDNPPLMQHLLDSIEVNGAVKTDNLPHVRHLLDSLEVNGATKIDDNLPHARHLLDRVLPHVRFPMIKPEQLALLEDDAFVQGHIRAFNPYMVTAYKYHAVPKEHRKGDAFLFGNNSTLFRNYTNRNISIHMQFDNYSQRSRSNFTWQFTTLASASNADVLNKIKWEINFRPKGYSDYYNNNESTRFTLEIQNKEVSLETEVAIFVLTRHQETNFVNLVTQATFLFGSESKVFKIENLLNLRELLKKDCPMIIDDTLNLIVFVKAKSPAE